LSYEELILNKTESLRSDKFDPRQVGEKSIMTNKKTRTKNHESKQPNDYFDS